MCRWLDVPLLRDPLNIAMIEARRRVILAPVSPRVLPRGEAMREACAPRPEDGKGAGNNPLDMGCVSVHNIIRERVTMRTNIVLDIEARKGFDTLPRAVSLSLMVRLLGKAFASMASGESAASFKKRRDADPDLKLAADYMREVCIKYLS